jgi:hypothetical protein
MSALSVLYNSSRSVCLNGHVVLMADMCGGLHAAVQLFAVVWCGCVIATSV